MAQPTRAFLRLCGIQENQLIYLQYVHDDCTLLVYALFIETTENINNFGEPAQTRYATVSWWQRIKFHSFIR